MRPYNWSDSGTLGQSIFHTLLTFQWTQFKVHKLKAAAVSQSYYLGINYCQTTVAVPFLYSQSTMALWRFKVRVKSFSKQSMPRPLNHYYHVWDEREQLSSVVMLKSITRRRCFPCMLNFHMSGEGYCIQTTVYSLVTIVQNLIWLNA